MNDSCCRVLLVNDNPVDLQLIELMISDADAPLCFANAIAFEHSGPLDGPQCIEDSPLTLVRRRVPFHSWTLWLLARRRDNGRGNTASDEGINTSSATLEERLRIIVPDHASRPLADARLWLIELLGRLAANYRDLLVGPGAPHLPGTPLQPVIDGGTLHG